MKDGFFLLQKRKLGRRKKNALIVLKIQPAEQALWEGNKCVALH